MQPGAPRSLRLALAGWAALLFAGPGAAAAAAGCEVGAYRLTDGSLVDVAPSEGGTLRWRRLDGTTGLLREQPDGSWRSHLGWTDRPDGRSVYFTGCPSEGMHFDGMSGRRIALEVQDTRFTGREVELAGRLVLPRGRGQVPVVVLLHGSERTSALVAYALQRILPAEGVGVFVYDKRGTGASGGKYTQDFGVLADDAVAALREARRLAGPRAGRMGYQAGSQGGWVAPIAATRAPVDFVIVCFGLAVSVIDEDQQQVALEMGLKGWGQTEIARAQEVAAAAEAVMASGFTEGFARLDELRARYRQEPWYRDLHGNYTHLLLPHAEAELRALGPSYDFGTPFHYDPMPTLRAVTASQLWVLGEDDLEAPSAETSRRLQVLIAEGRPITLALYPGAEHGMTEYQLGPDGSRLSTRYPAGYFAMILDFARRGRLRPPYGQAALSGPGTER